MIPGFALHFSIAKYSPSPGKIFGESGRFTVTSLMVGNSKLLTVLPAVTRDPTISEIYSCLCLAYSEIFFFT